MNQSASIASLAKALNIAQSEIEPAKKDSENPFYKSTYADLDACWQAIRQPLTKNGLSITQGCRFTTHWSLVTKMLHTSGEWIEFEMPLFMKDQTPQAAGSAISYARRYSLAAITGLTQQDDDAEEAQKGYSKDTNAFKPSQAVDSHKNQATANTISEAQSKRLFAIAMGSGYTVEDLNRELFKKYKYMTSGSINRRDYDDIVAHFQKPKPKAVHLKDKEPEPQDLDIPFN